MLWLNTGDDSVVTIIICMAIISGLAAFGFGLNDVADRSFDLQAGKDNRAKDLPPASWCLFLIVTAILPLLLSLVRAPDHAATVFLLVGLGLAVLYSVPPVRLKERGFLGIVAGAAAQWAIPVLIASSFEVQGWNRVETWFLSLLALFIGVRWMGIHQVIDTDADREAGIHTYATEGGSVEALVSGVFKLELGLLVFLFVFTWSESIPPLIAFGLWLIMMFMVYLGDRLRSGTVNDYWTAPLAEYYFLLLPVSLAVAKAWTEPLFLCVLLIFVVLGAGQVARFLRELRAAWG